MNDPSTGPAASADKPAAMKTTAQPWCRFFTHQWSKWCRFFTHQWSKSEWFYFGIPVLLSLVWLFWWSWSSCCDILNGFAFSIVVGAVVSRIGWYFFHSIADVVQSTNEGKEVRINFLPFTLGIVERIFITVLVGCDVNGAGSFVIGWIAVKAAGGWAKIAQNDSTCYSRAVYMAGLLCSMTSAFMAVLGGLLFRHVFRP
jgi:hypothetical protein